MHCTVLTLTPCAAAITRTRPIFPAQIGEDRGLDVGSDLRPAAPQIFGPP
jgi:hypothetical protein